MKFDTRDKKPKIWDVAILSAAAVIAVAVLAAVGGGLFAMAISLIVTLYYAAVIVMLLNAFHKQLQYNPYSYNVIYYLGFSLFVFFVLTFHVSSSIQMFSGSAAPVIEQSLTVLNGAPRKFLFLISAYVIPLAVALAISNIALIRHEGFKPVNALGIFLGIFLAGGLVFLWLYDRNTPEEPGARLRHELIESLVISFYLYF